MFQSSSERYSISRIEIIKVLPEINTSENPEELIMDPWKTFECEENKASAKLDFKMKILLQIIEMQLFMFEPYKNQVSE